jgi:hypothetical protein
MQKMEGVRMNDFSQRQGEKLDKILFGIISSTKG